MKWPLLRVLWGLLLVAAGVLFLLNSTGTISIGDYQWAIILVIGGLAFLSVFLADREHWWALIPGGILALIGLGFFIAEASVEYILAAGLIVAGIIIVVRQFTKKDEPVQMEKLPEEETQDA